MPVTLLGVGAGILIGAAGGIIVQRYRHRLERKQTADKWYADALGLISRAERIGHRTTEYQEETDTETLRSNLEPLSEDLKEHAARAPSSIPQEARDRLDVLADITTGLIIVSEKDDNMTGTEMLANLQMFVSERVDDEDEDLLDIEQVNEIISTVDTDSMAEDLPAEDVDFDEEELEDLLAQVSDETLQAQQIQSVDDAVNFPFMEANELLDDVDIVDEVMNDGMREYVRLWLIDATDDMFNEMEVCRKRV
ncbi:MULTISPECIES: hypothetical protein [Halorussus]|uniref:hypothetical protein n=1 Tax=Halorussus TaxID=1070314 RepID=UPI000E2171F0|nr:MULTISPECIES: hypothetical protein [Halorussus]NHN60450.1 hypothetical protein [Halorussus sp. JP-T4]